MNFNGTDKFEVFICFANFADLSALLFELSTILNAIKYPWKNLRHLFGEWRIFHGKIILSSRGFVNCEIEKFPSYANKM